MGYIFAGSLASVVCASIFATLLFLFGYKTLKGSVRFETLALLTTLILDLFFSYRFWTSKALFPAGIVVMLASSLMFFVSLSIKKRSIQSN
jgi:uncharacterized membrane protein (UPF0136 family)